MKKEYETVWEIFNECANNQMRDVFFDEIETDDPEAYIRQKFPDKNLKYEKSEVGILFKNGRNEDGWKRNRRNNNRNIRRSFPNIRRGSEL